MAGKLSPKAQMKLAALNDFAQKVQRVYGLVEQYAADRSAKGGDVFLMAIKRGFGQLKREFMGAGMDSLSQLCGSMEIAASRGSSQITKSRILREGVGSLRFQIEMEQRITVSEDEREQEKAKDS